VRELDEINVVRAVKAGDLETLRALITQSPELIGITRGCDGRTLLHIAAQNGDASMVVFLLKSGADVNAKTTPAGWTVIHAAVKGGNQEVVQLILDQGANVDVKTIRGLTPLKLARASEKKAIASLLVTKGARE